MDLTARKFSELGVTAEYHGVKLSLFCGSKKTRKYFHNYCQRAMENMKGRGTGLFVIGPQNSGKTFLGVCAMKAYLHAGYTARRINLDELVSVHVESYRDGSLLDPFKAAHLLFIDSVGQEKPNDTVGYCLSGLLNFRNERRLATIIGSSVDLDTLDSQYSKYGLPKLVRRNMVIIRISEINGLERKLYEANKRIVK